MAGNEDVSWDLAEAFMKKFPNAEKVDKYLIQYCLMGDNDTITTRPVQADSKYLVEGSNAERYENLEDEAREIDKNALKEKLLHFKDTVPPGFTGTPDEYLEQVNAFVKQFCEDTKTTESTLKSAFKHSFLPGTDNQHPENNMLRVLHDQKLGEGAFGKVYDAQLGRNGEIVAVKIGGASEKEEKALQKELELTRIGLGIGELRGREREKWFKGEWRSNKIYLIQKKLPGEDLTEKMSRRDSAQEAITALDVVQILKDVVAKTNALNQEKQLLHRDIKMQNIRYHNGEARLMDFGAAKNLRDDDVIEENGERVFYSQDIEGSPPFTAPEIAKPNDERGARYSARSEIFAIGMMGYFLMGKKPNPEVIAHIESMGAGSGYDDFYQMFIEQLNQFGEPGTEPSMTMLQSLMRDMISDDFKTRPNAAQVQQRLNDIESTLLAELAHTSIAQLDAAIRAQEQLIEPMQQQIDATEKAIAEKQNEINTIQKRMNDLDSKIKELNIEIEALDDEVDLEAMNEQEEKQEERDALQQEYDDLYAQQEAVTTDELQESLNNLYNQILTPQAKILELEAIKHQAIAQQQTLGEKQKEHQDLSSSDLSETSPSVSPLSTPPSSPESTPTSSPGSTPRRARAVADAATRPPLPQGLGTPGGTPRRERADDAVRRNPPPPEGLRAPAEAQGPAQIPTPVTGLREQTREQIAEEIQRKTQQLNAVNKEISALGNTDSLKYKGLVSTQQMLSRQIRVLMEENKQPLQPTTQPVAPPNTPQSTKEKRRGGFFGMFGKKPSTNENEEKEKTPRKGDTPSARKK